MKGERDDLFTLAASRAGGWLGDWQRAATQWREALARGLGLTPASAWWLLGSPPTAGSAARPRPRSSTPGEAGPDLKLMIARLRLRLHRIAGDNWEDEVVTHGRQVLAMAASSHRAVIAWVSLIESLVQGAEAELAGRSGAEKKAVVKIIARRLYRKERLSLPHVPAWAEPMVIDVLVDVGIDAVVALTDHHNHWAVAPEERPVRGWSPLHLLWTAFAAAKELLGRLLRPLLRLAGHIYTVVTDLLRRAIPIPSGLQAALREVDTAEIARDINDFNAFLEEAVGWVTTNKGRILALIELIGDVVKTAEELLEDGAQRKVYARQLMLLVLEETGIYTGRGIGALLIELAVDQAIDAVVHLFNKRGTFHHRHPQGAAPTG